MGLEIERKFLLANDSWREKVVKKTPLRQGYLNSNKERTVRVRTTGTKAFLTIKGKNINTTRLEFEYEIPLIEGEELLNLCEKPLIEKVRYEVFQNGFNWEIDVFEGENEGLLVAEVELEEEGQEVVLPNWVGKEVSDDARYYNACLVKNPFRNW